MNPLIRAIKGLINIDLFKGIFLSNEQVIKNDYNKYDMMTESRISFDAMPQMLADIAEKLMSIETKVDNLTVPLLCCHPNNWHLFIFN